MASRVLGYLIVAVACLAIGLVIGTQVIRAAESTGTNRSSFGIGGASGPSTNNLAAAQATGAAITQGLSAVGEATVKAQPDLAILNIGVQSQADTAQAAQDDNNQKMQAVIDALKGAGIAAEDIRTSGLSLHPVHDERGQITRYQANNSVVVTIHDITRAGEIFDLAVAAGANQAGSLQFGFKDESALRQQALEDAIAAARQKADRMAQAAGVTLGSIQIVAEESTGGPIPIAMPAVARDAMSTPVEPGQIGVTARVQVVFSIS